MTNILYCGLLYNYGKPEEGYSYEHFNFEAGLKDCADRGMFNLFCLYPDNCDNINATSLDFIIDGSIDIIIHFAFNESFDFPELAAKLALKKDIPVIQFDADSSWRFHNWILPRKDRVSHFITTHSGTIPWYQQHGMKVLKSQWAGSPYYHPKNLDKTYDTTFVGQRHGRMPDGRFVRSEIINSIMDAGLQIDLFGNYWDGYPNWHGYIKDFHKMIEVFDQSKICLNLSNPWHYGSMPQVKGRHFEIPQIGRLQICTPADNLEEYFDYDKEIIVVNNVDELIEKIKYYIEHEDEREKVAQAGRKRMLKEHQWSHRFESIFNEL